MTFLFHGWDVLVSMARIIHSLPWKSKTIKIIVPNFGWLRCHTWKKTLVNACFFDGLWTSRVLCYWYFARAQGNKRDVPPENMAVACVGARFSSSSRSFRPGKKCKIWETDVVWVRLVVFQHSFLVSMVEFQGIRSSSSSSSSWWIWCQPKLPFHLLPPFTQPWSSPLLHVAVPAAVVSLPCFPFLPFPGDAETKPGPMTHPWDDCIFTYMNGSFYHFFHVGKYTIPYMDSMGCGVSHPCHPQPQKHPQLQGFFWWRSWGQMISKSTPPKPFVGCQFLVFRLISLACWPHGIEEFAKLFFCVWVHQSYSL